LRRARSAPYVHNNCSTDRLRFCAFSLEKLARCIWVVAVVMYIGALRALFAEAALGVSASASTGAAKRRAARGRFLYIVPVQRDGEGVGVGWGVDTTPAAALRYKQELFMSKACAALALTALQLRVSRDNLGFASSFGLRASHSVVDLLLGAGSATRSARCELHGPAR
jgi:hypothetical protein